MNQKQKEQRKLLKMDKISYWYEPSYTNEKMSNAISRTYILPKLGSFKYFDCEIAFYPDVTHRQVFVTYRNCLIYRILKITVFTYDEIEWENLVQKDIMRTRNRLMKPSRDVLDRLFYHDIIYEIDKRFVL
jgi:hypothetical protein